MWEAYEKVAYVEVYERGCEVVLFRVEDGVLKFVGMREVSSEECAEEYLRLEGYRRTNKRIEMRTKDTHEPIDTPTEVHKMPTVLPGQVWQNGRVVVSVQKEAGNLNLVQFEIKGRGLKFTAAKMFEDTEKASRYITGLNCVLTDKVLAAADESLSVI